MWLKIVKAALKQICEKIKAYRRAGWTDKNRPVQMAIAQHDRILKRWPKAYDS